MRKCKECVEKRVQIERISTKSLSPSFFKLIDKFNVDPLTNKKKHLLYSFPFLLSTLTFLLSKVTLRK